MPSDEEIRQAQFALDWARGNRVLAVTITYKDWMDNTALGWTKPRSSEMKAIDAALKAYGDASKTMTSFIALKNAFENWIRKEEAAHRAWTGSERNHSKRISMLKEQIDLVEAGRSLQLMKNSKDWEARKALLAAERDAVKRLFEHRKLIFKDLAWKSEVASAVKTWVAPTAQMMKSAHTLNTSGMNPASPNSVPGALDNVLDGQSPRALFDQLGVDFTSFVKAAGNIVSLAITPAKLLIDIGVLAYQIKTRMMVNRERYMFRAGNADAALNAIIRLIDRDMVLNAIDMGKQVTSLVAGAFQAQVASSAVNAMVSTMVNLKLHAMMAQEMDDGNRLLRENMMSLDLFNTTPLLGCYFLLMADTSVWINYSVFDIGTPGWTETVKRMKDRADPVLDKARSYIRVARFALSGTEGFRGLEWEPTWKRNKWQYLTRFVNSRPDQLGGFLAA